mmetsp:Transcript_102563/g.318897  ORF Transcript_102563/g.318897 Transcript_102563/m.318897 type:complete len:320 (-) Transcript_102563:652-1611(-)
MRRGDAALEGRRAGPHHLLVAPGGRRHADIGHRTEEVVAAEQLLVLLQRQRVAVHRAAVPEQEVTGSGREQPWAAVALREDLLVSPHADVVPAAFLARVAAKELAMEAVRARHHDEATSAWRRVGESQEALDAMQAALPVGLVHVPPVRLLRLPGGLVAVGPEDAGAVEGADEVLSAPERREGLADVRQAADVPEGLRLADATRMDDAILRPCGPSAAPLRRVPPGLHTVAPHSATGVGLLDEGPEEAIGRGHLPGAGGLRDDAEALVVEVPQPGGLVAQRETRWLQEACEGQLRQRLSVVQQPVDVPHDLVGAGVGER